MKIKVAHLIASGFGALLACSASAEPMLQAHVGVDMWFGDSKINDIRREDEALPSGYLTIENQLPYIPHLRLRYTTFDTHYLSFDKYDLTFYYHVLEHDLMHFDAGIALLNFSDTQYRDGATNQINDFDKTAMTWFLAAELNIPSTPADILGEVSFSDNDGFKTTDFIAGVQYRIPTGENELALRTGYRVIDLESSSKFSSSLGDDYVFIDGWFLGMRYQF